MSTFSGYAAVANVRAADGLCVTLGALRCALPDYLLRGGPILAVHARRPIGKVTSAHVDAKGLYITANIHEAVALAKLAGRVFRGWSIGFRFSSTRDLTGNTLSGLDLDEISVCPEPACPGALIQFSQHPKP